MNNNLIRIGAGLAVVIGLAYVGNQVFNKPAADAPAAAGDAQTAAGPAANPRGFAVYPDAATNKELGLDYATFNGNFVNDVTVTPLPPGFAGVATMRILPGQAKSIEIALNEAKCESPVHVVLYHINNRTPVASAALKADAMTLSFPVPEGNIAPMLLEIRMDDKAKNNYWCGVSVRWVQQ